MPSQKVAIEDNRVLHPCGLHRTTGQAGPYHHPTHSTGPAKTGKYPIEEVAKSIVLCLHLGRPSVEKTGKLSIAPLAKVIEDKLGRPVQLMMNIASSEVKAASVAPAPGRVILLATPRTCGATLATSWT